MLQVFKICVFPVAQLVLIIAEYLVLFANRFCSNNLLNGSILKKTHFNIIFLRKFFSDIAWNKYLLTLPTHHLDESKNLFSSFVACLALKPVEIFLRLPQKCHVVSCWSVKYLKTARIYRKTSTSFQILGSPSRLQEVPACWRGNCLYFV